MTKEVREKLCKDLAVFMWKYEYFDCIDEDLNSYEEVLEKARTLSDDKLVEQILDIIEQSDKKYKFKKYC